MTIVVKKSSLEVGISTGLVAMMIVLILIISVVAPAGLKSAGYSLAMLLFIASMGFAGMKLIDMP